MPPIIHDGYHQEQIIAKAMNNFRPSNNINSNATASGSSINRTVQQAEGSHGSIGAVTTSAAAVASAPVAAPTAASGIGWDAGGILGGIGRGFGNNPSILQDSSIGCGVGNSNPLFQLLNSIGGGDHAVPTTLGAAGAGTVITGAGLLDLARGVSTTSSGSAVKGGGQQKKKKSSIEADGVNVTDMELQNAEDALASELSNLSMEQRKQIEDDIVGEALNIPAEEPEFVQRCLQQMDDEIKRLISHNSSRGASSNRANKQASSNTSSSSNINKGPYERAIFLAPKRYLNNKDFHLMFLRADEFNPKNAAIRLIKFFEVKELLFGEAKLCKRITIEDLTDDMYDDGDDKEEDRTAKPEIDNRSNDGSTSTKRNKTREIFLSGTLQTLPSTDRFGRPVMMFIPKFCPVKHPGKHLFRVIWYHIMVALESSTAQKRGFVHIQYEVGKTTPRTEDGSSMTTTISGFEASMESVRYSRIVADALPIRYAGIHYCYDDRRVQALSVMFTTLSRSMRLRFKFHFGKDVECLYSVMSYGIAQGLLPIDLNGKLQTSDFDRFVERRRRIERGEIEEGGNADDEINGQGETSGSTTTLQPCVTSIEAPTPRDVLLGRGKPYQDFIGNIRFGQLVDQYLDRHNNAPKFEKTILSMSVVQSVKNRSGRFLKKNKDTDLWDVVPDEVARDKVAHAFRTKTQRNNIGATSNNMGGNNTKNKRPKLK